VTEPTAPTEPTATAATAATAATSDLAERIETILRDEAVATDGASGQVRVSGLRRLTGGSSRDIWQFTATARPGEAERQLVLRMDHPGESRPAGIRLEAQVMAVAAKTGVQVPLVLAVIDDASILGAPALIMEKIEGETSPRRVIAACAAGGTGAALARQCGAAIGRLHHTAVSEFPAVPRYSRLDTYRAALDRIDPNRPVLELAYRYLVDTRPPSRPPVVVHGDFRLGNLVVSPDGHHLRAVLDWESSHLSDAVEDLGWIAIRAWRFRGPGLVGGFGDVGDFLAGYAEQAGWAPADAEFGWALVLNTWIWAVGCLEQAERHLTGRVRSVDLAVVGRRVVEIERDLLELLP
jgi:aminoglycoside phosphotransferase (APT) family kinase protein